MIGNILQTRKHRVVLVFPSTSIEISLSSEEIDNGIEIESKIVSEIVKMHEDFMKGTA